MLRQLLCIRYPMARLTSPSNGQTAVRHRCASLRSVHRCSPFTSDVKRLCSSSSCIPGKPRLRQVHLDIQVVARCTTSAHTRRPSGARSSVREFRAWRCNLAGTVAFAKQVLRHGCASWLNFRVAPRFARCGTAKVARSRGEVYAVHISVSGQPLCIRSPVARLTSPSNGQTAVRHRCASLRSVRRCSPFTSNVRHRQ